MCLLLPNSLQLPIPFIPPSFPVLELMCLRSCSPTTLYFHSLLLCITCSFYFPKFPRHLITRLYHALHFFLASPHPWVSSIPSSSSPLVHPSVHPSARQAFLPPILLVSVLHCGMIDSHQERGVITTAAPKDEPLVMRRLLKVMVIKTRGLENMLIIVSVVHSRPGGQASHICWSSRGRVWDDREWGGRGLFGWSFTLFPK